MRISDWSSDVCSSDLYERCLDGLALDYGLTPLIGVGSMCRREVSGPEGLIAVFDHLDRILPKGVMLHGFGVKGTALSHLKGIEHRIASIDSQAYGQAARPDRSEARRVGKECDSTFRSGW